jgi:predicted Zn-dependent protease
MEDIGGDPRALGDILARIVGDKAGDDKDRRMKILLDHPETGDRIAAIDALAASRPTMPLLNAADWSALKQICSAPPAKGATTAPGDGR